MTQNYVIAATSIGKQRIYVGWNKYFASLTSVLRPWWNSHENRWFKIFFVLGGCLSFTANGLLCFNDTVVIPAAFHPAKFDDLHSGHVDVDTMRLFELLSCWFRQLDSAILRTFKTCENCLHKIPFESRERLLWLSLCKARQLAHANCCGTIIYMFPFRIIFHIGSKYMKSSAAKFTETVMWKRSCSVCVTYGRCYSAYC